MSFEPKRYCAYGDHRVYAMDFRDDRRSICGACHAKRERDNRSSDVRAREIKRRWKYLIHYAHRRAQKADVPFDLFEHQAEIKRRVEAGLCEMTGLPFNVGGVGRAWDSPSIDRIRPADGYVLSNVRVILFGLNFAMADWGEDVFAKMARSYFDARS